MLSGVIGGLLAQGLAPAEAAIVALHAGMLAAEQGTARYGVGGLVAGDMPVLVAEDPLTCVVRGCGMALERMDKLVTIFTNE